MATPNSRRNDKRPSSDSRAQFDIVRRPRNEVSLEDNSTTMMNFEPPQVVAKLMEFIGTREEAVLFVNEEFGRKMGKTLKRGGVLGRKGGNYLRLSAVVTPISKSNLYSQEKTDSHKVKNLLIEILVLFKRILL